MKIEFDTAEAIISILSEDNKINVVDKVDYVNIFVFRKNRVFTNRFDDKIYWLWKDKENQWQLRKADVTSKAGLYYVKNPLSKKGVAILKSGFLKNSHQLGLHQGKYTALVQAKPLQIYRDNDKDDWADYKPESIEEDYFGINIHRANMAWKSKTVDKWSAGCQVFADPNLFNQFIEQCQKHKELYGNIFSLFLIEEELKK